MLLKKINNHILVFVGSPKTIRRWGIFILFHRHISGISAIS